MLTSSEITLIVALLTAFLFAGKVVMHVHKFHDHFNENRDIQLDGLRPLLAFGVIVFHFIGIRKLIDTDVLEFHQNSAIASLLGRDWAVPIFFAITAYLFSSRLTHITNVTGKDNFKFIVGRCFRLIPMTFVSSLMFFVLTPATYFKYPFDFQNFGQLINTALSSLLNVAVGPKSTTLESWEWQIANGAQWTLHYEWIFYLSVVSISFFTFKKQNMILSITVFLFMLALVDGLKDFYIYGTYSWAFVPGFIAGLFKKRIFRAHLFKSRVTAWLSILLVILSAFTDLKILKILVNTFFIAIVVARNPVTRLLECNLLRSIGETTYSLYLIHGLVQYVALKHIFTLQYSRSMPDWAWYLSTSLQVVVTVVLARISFEYVEKPGIESGKLFFSWVVRLKNNSMVIRPRIIK